MAFVVNRINNTLGGSRINSKVLKFPGWNWKFNPENLS